ncbi:MAG TPA: GntR family transcriptional regulator [Actinomycetota bacterium]|nr:GntR family transcriptional regulator [Actinomycetota bacterium]
MEAGARTLGRSIDWRSTTEQVAAALREAILSGEILPGTPLREVRLAGTIGVSRNTVREATRTLAAEGLVRYKRNRGVVVTELSDEDVDELYQARGVLEWAGAEALRSSRREAVFEALGRLVDDIEAAFAHGDVAGVLDGDRRFHATLVSALGNPRLDQCYAGLQRELRLALTLTERSSVELGRQRDDHRVLLEAIRRGTAREARKALAEHLATGVSELHRLRELVVRLRGGR